MQLSAEDRAKHTATFNSLHPENGFVSGVFFLCASHVSRPAGSRHLHKIKAGHASLGQDLVMAMVLPRNSDSF